MKIEKVTYDTQYPYLIKDEWGGEVCLTKEDLKELKKVLDKMVKA